jgi:hypothetical protein
MKALANWWLRWQDQEGVAEDSARLLRVGLARRPAAAGRPSRPTSSAAASCAAVRPEAKRLPSRPAGLTLLAG